MGTNKNPHIKAWTTEHETAVIWGTHNIEEAKSVYRDLHMDTEPDWDDFRSYWGRPGLDEKEVWQPGDYEESPGLGCIVPFLIFEF